ncbi:Uma2 family endonuclease [Argonema galeatum]|uniref:Uma2 family endonuclease n=1 Tax=Argonema galeatum TaxID=2942762 RepID=UPI0020126330|nr:Uma2 family endonuclease [Argonema galeatum]MCL1464626.1 Uma2 family endonuclease [Argonema galeatum A003/A1]
MIQLQTSPTQEIVYPDSDDQPMSDNTEQFQWIVTIKENLEILFAADPDVFVAGDLLWYPVEGNNKIRQAPDAMVAFSRPKGKRGSYKQWRENNIAPQVVFEIISPGNTIKEMAKKLDFYNRYGVEEYYIYDPERVDLAGWQRNSQQELEVIEEINGWVSPRLEIRFEITEDSLQIYRPDGSRFLTSVELEQRARDAEQRAQDAEERVQILEARLRELGVDPNQL